MTASGERTETDGKSTDDPLRAREEDGDAGSAPTRHELASTTFVPFSAPTDGVRREGARGGDRGIPEEIPVNIAVTRGVMGWGGLLF